MRNGKVIGFGMLALLTAAGTVGFSEAQPSTGAGVETAGARLLEINGVVGQVEVRTSPGGVFNIEIIPGKKLSAQVERDGITLRIKGPMERNSRTNCSTRGSGSERVHSMSINGTRYNREDLPRIIVSGPDNMGLRIKNSFIGGRAGNVGGATIEHSSCDTLTLGNVANDLETSLSASGNFQAGNVGGRVEANLAGSGDVRFGDVGRDLELNVAGSGDARVGRVGGRTDVNVAGSGDVEIASVSALADVNVAGSGDVTLASGRSQLSANISGSGDIVHRGTAIDPQVNIIGSGDVVVARVEGQPSVSRLGSGNFRVN